MKTRAQASFTSSDCTAPTTSSFPCYSLGCGGLSAPSRDGEPPLLVRRRFRVVGFVLQSCHGCPGLVYTMVLSPLPFLGFKHCAGRATELVMQWAEAGRKVRRPKGGKDDDGKSDNECRFRKGSELALKQLLLVMVECTTVPVEAIARLGCSCFRWEDFKKIFFSLIFSSI